MVEAQKVSNDEEATFVAVSLLETQQNATMPPSLSDPLFNPRRKTLPDEHVTTTTPPPPAAAIPAAALFIAASHLNLCEFRLNQKRQQEECLCYQHSHPLVYNMLKNEEQRRRQLQKEGAVQMKNQPTSNAGSWIKTLFVIEGRALGFIFWPWCVIVGHAIVYTCLNELVLNDSSVWSGNVADELSSWETVFGIALNATLSLLLVFRLNRAAARWWLARQYWGLLIAKTRVLVSGIVLHGKHDAASRDNAIRWTATYAICVMEFLRGCHEMHDDLFAGILSPSEKAVVEQQSHPPLYAAHQIHYYLYKLLATTTTTTTTEDNTVTSLALVTARSRQLATLEAAWEVLSDQCGAMERIKATPLPIVYVSHLRTFLLVALLLYPYVWGDQWKWSTIPIVALAALGMLGIEAASVEVEQPFSKDRINALNMDGFWYVQRMI